MHFFDQNENRGSDYLPSKIFWLSSLPLTALEGEYVIGTPNISAMVASNLLYTTMKIDNILYQ